MFLWILISVSQIMDDFVKEEYYIYAEVWLTLLSHKQWCTARGAKAYQSMKEMQASEYRKDHLMEKWSHSSSAGLSSGSATVGRRPSSSTASFPIVWATASIATTLSRQFCDLGTKRNSRHIPAQTASIAWPVIHILVRRTETAERYNWPGTKMYRKKETARQTVYNPT